MAADLRRVKELFVAALEVPAGEARNAFLQQACGEDAALRERVEVLLAAHDVPVSALDKPLAGEAAPLQSTIASERPPQDLAGTLVAGRYKLLEQIGEGGMGTVWVAEQTEPVKRKVALKLIKAGMDSRSVLARFEAERQALSLMDHPNIAKVLDGGLTDAGRPFFVMEYVKGIPITEYCDSTRLSLPERLNLFILVCSAVQHAHQKGIIHRDLKPSNILVAPYDDKPVPKIIDFGLAKAMYQSLTERTLHTAHDSVLGTPLYMSPEQAQLNNLDVDTRSDIYSLGVLLYELLTGTTPLEKKRFREAAWDEVCRIIREEEPPRPSTRLSSTGTLPRLAACRQTEPAGLTKLIRGELDWIVMKALEKDRTRRYETANGFALDVQRYLSGEPVLAVPPSTGYRLRKFARRNKRGLLTAACVVVGAFIAVGAVGWAVRDRVARQQAAFKEQEARQTRLEQEIARALEDVSSAYRQDKLPEAMAAVKRAEALLVSGDAREELQQRVQRWRVDLETVDRLESIYLERSEVKPWYHDWKGADRAYEDVFRRYGVDLEVAEPASVVMTIRASAVRDRLVAGLDEWLGIARGINRRAGERILAVVRDADPDPWRNRLRDVFWRDDTQAVRQLAEHPSVSSQPPVNVLLLTSLLKREEDHPLAIEVLRKAQRRFPASFWINYALGSKILASDDPELFSSDAVGFLRAAAALRPRNSVVHSSLGLSLRRLEKADDAEAALREAIRCDPDYALGRNNLANILMFRDRLDEAETEIRRAISLKPEMGIAHFTFGEIMERRGKPIEAAARLRQALRFDLEPSICFACTAHLLLLDGVTSEYRPACDRLRNSYAQDKQRWNTYFVARTCALAPGSTPDPVQAVRLAELAVEAEPKWAHNLHTLGLAHYRAGQLDQAVQRFHEAIEVNPEWTGQVVNWLGLTLAYHRQGQTNEARRWFEKALEWIDRVAPNGNRESLTAPSDVHDHEWLASRLLRREAETLLKEVVPTDRKSKLGADHTSTRGK
jgi:serine/threonine protein kinase/tetratricopeptide (TPR) repeat protein